MTTKIQLSPIGKMREGYVVGERPTATARRDRKRRKKKQKDPGTGRVASSVTSEMIWYVLSRPAEAAAFAIRKCPFASVKMMGRPQKRLVSKQTATTYSKMRLAPPGGSFPFYEIVSFGPFLLLGTFNT